MKIEYIYIIFFMFLLFPILQVLFISLIIQMRIILNTDFQKRYNELGEEFTKAFYIDIFIELLRFVIFFYVFGLVFYKSIKDYPDFIKILFIVVSLIIIIFDIIIFTRIAAKQLKDFQSDLPLFAFPSIPVFHNKKISYISNPMSSGYYWSFLLLFLFIIFLLVKE